MANTFIKPEIVVGAVLGALQREIVLPGLIWMDPAGDFKGAKDDTITLSIPAVSAGARSRTMRSGTTRTRDHLSEGKVALKLDTNLYKDVEITDEELTLDIADLGRQVLQPIVTGLAEGWEDAISTKMTGATYAKSVAWVSGDPQKVFLKASQELDLARVPKSGRVAVVGANLAYDILSSDNIRRFDSAGAAGSQALQDATIMPIAGFGNIVTAPGLDPDFGVAFHRTAFAATSKAPLVPGGVTYGTTMNANGLTMRMIRQFDASADTWADILGFDSFVGVSVVEDHGAFNGNGQWVPAADPDNDNGTDLHLIRAVAIGDAGS